MGGVGEHADNAGGALVVAHLGVEAMAHLLLVGGDGDRDRSAVRHVGHQGAEGEDQLDIGGLRELHQLDGERPPPERRLDPVDQHDIAADRRVGGDEDAGGAPTDPALSTVDDDPGPVDLEVVVVLGIERGDRLGTPELAQVLDDRRSGIPGVVPAFEGGDHDRVVQLRKVLELDHASSCVVESQPYAVAVRAARTCCLDSLT